MYVIPESKIVEVRGLYQSGLSVRSVAKVAGVATQTALRYRPNGLICPCGKEADHKEWCSWRLSNSPARQAYLQRCAQQTAATRLAMVSARREISLTTWPYVQSFDNEDYALLKQVNDLVPRSLPEAVRADVCQEIIIDVIQGNIDVNQIPAQLKAYLRRAYKFLPSKFGPLSLDAPLFGSDGRVLAETLAG